MTSELQRVAQELVECLDMMPRVIEALRERARRCREAAGYVGGLSAGNPSLMAAAHHLDAAANACEEAAHFGSLAHQRGRGWAAQMVGEGGSGGSAGIRPSTPTSPAAKAPPRPGPAPNRGRLPESTREVDPVAQELIRAKLPTRDDPKDKTHGLWIDAQGKEHKLVSGYDYDRSLAEQYRIDQGFRPTVATSHVEVKFAMMMRRLGLETAELFINNKPCEGPDSCSRYLPDFLPPGARLLIHWPGAKPVTFEGRDSE